MSMSPRSWPEPSPEIAAAVRKIYARKTPPLAMAVRDQLPEVFPDAEFSHAYGTRGRPAFSPGLLALVTVLQMAENLTDRQAADAARKDLTWKYALGLGLADEGFDASVLSEFRSRVVEHGLEERALDLLLAALKEKGLVKASGRQRTDTTHVISAVRDLNRLELAGESVRAAVEALAVAAPGWLATATPSSKRANGLRAKVRYRGSRLAIAGTMTLGQAITPTPAGLSRRGCRCGRARSRESPFPADFTGPAAAGQTLVMMYS